jgi:hypothetical protein
MEANTSKHSFCLEKCHIIVCGYSIKCDPSIPDELWNYFKYDQHVVFTPFRSNGDYTSRVISSMKTDTIRNIEDVVRNFDRSNDNFVEEFFRVCL